MDDEDEQDDAEQGQGDRRGAEPVDTERDVASRTGLGLQASGAG